LSIQNNNEPRFRISAKQTAKGLWYFDATVEHNSDKLTRSIGTIKDVAETVTEPLGLRLLSMIKECEKAFKEDKRQMVNGEQIV